MNKYFNLIIFSITLHFLSFSQKVVHYTLSAEAHALMCPFLTPQLMELLSQKGAIDVKRNDQMQLLFYTKKENELSDELIFKLVDQIGYEVKNFSVARKEE
jgi:hypothetical protein